MLMMSNFMLIYIFHSKLCAKLANNPDISKLFHNFSTFSYRFYYQPEWYLQDGDTQRGLLSGRTPVSAPLDASFRGQGICYRSLRPPTLLTSSPTMGPSVARLLPALRRSSSRISSSTPKPMKNQEKSALMAN